MILLLLKKIILARTPRYEGAILDRPQQWTSAHRCAASRRPAARAPRAAALLRRRAWLRIFVVRCSLPCDPPVGGHSCNAGMIPRFHRAVCTDADGSRVKLANDRLGSKAVRLRRGILPNWQRGPLLRRAIQRRYAPAIRFSRLVQDEMMSRGP